MKKPHAPNAVRSTGSLVDRVVRYASKAMATRCGARRAAESGPAPKTQTTTTETPMKSKVSSKRVAEIASRILRGKPYSEREAKAVAGSVIAQSKAAAKKAPAKRRRR